VAQIVTDEPEQLGRRRFLKTAGRTVTSAVLAAGGISTLSENKAYGANPDDDLEKYGANPDDDLEKYDFVLARVKFSAEEGPEDYWTVYPEADTNLLRSFSSVVRCKVKVTPDRRGQRGNQWLLNAVVEFSDFETLRRYPFVFMTSQYRYTLSAVEKRNLKRYILAGGFLMMDDCIVASAGDYFYQRSCELLREVFGQAVVRPIPHEHEIFHNVYDLGQTGVPHCHGTYHRAQGVFIGDRLAVWLSSTDVHCAWVGNHRLVREGIKMGVNILMYGLTH
jgi:hypothetical protein